MNKEIKNKNDGAMNETVEKSEVALREEAILAFWNEHDIFKKTVETPAGQAPVGDEVNSEGREGPLGGKVNSEGREGPLGDKAKEVNGETREAGLGHSEGREGALGQFVFYDGPPFATGTPHYGHILAGAIKDAIPRFQSMNGKRVVRKWGWDCHGLPLENIIEKRLGLATKRDIEAMGVKQFNEAAREAVLEYADDWKVIVSRMGRFVDMEDDYRTMDANYTESVWWVFSELNKKGLVYEGFKSMHLCPRCGTTLSNFEVNQGYKDIKDIAVTVKLPLLDEAGVATETSLLVWTTTPWTLPGNMAAAVHNDIEYVKAKVLPQAHIQTGGTNTYSVLNDEFVILAKEILEKHSSSRDGVYLLGEHELQIIEKLKGSSLVGKRYMPPFETWVKIFEKGDFLKQWNGTEWIVNEPLAHQWRNNTWKIYHADYVELGDEGTGAVHLAPAYGEEDMELAKRENIPLVHHVDVDGRFKEFVTHFSGQLVKPKDDETTDVSHLDADIEIVKRLKEAGKLFRKENITHSYPHCWRCQTPLLNYATTSWFVKVTDIKDKLVAENERVRWVPEHVGSNRFGRWLEGARDWAISRQRYWGAPLPVWRREDNNEYKVIGSLKDLQQYVPASGNRYFLMRHGESEYNTRELLNGEPDVKNGLTELGKNQTCMAYESLRAERIDLVYYSPLERTAETAHLIAEALGLSGEQLIADKRLLEMGFGEFECGQVNEYHAFFGSGEARLTKRPAGGESWTDVKRRVGDFMYEINTTHAGKNILIVSHNGTMQMLQAVANGDERTALGKLIDGDIYDLKNAEVRELNFVPLPHNDDYELDFHRPYIDEIVLHDTDGMRLARVPDVFDCWFESGSMPYAQHHYPFENSSDFLENKFPAQFIAEGLDQTRGWFYSLIVLGTALFGKSPYEQVIVSGLVLAEDGRKMSKSLQNYPDPAELMNRVGADAMRFYLLSSPVVRGEDLSFSEKEVLELQRKNIGRLHNVLAMYELYKDAAVEAAADSAHILDRWLIARLNETTNEITRGYETYELDQATRPLEIFIDDLSVWYLRRSRDRLKGVRQSGGLSQEVASDSDVRKNSGNQNSFCKEDEADCKAALATLRFALEKLSQLMAPVMPFYAEYLFQAVRNPEQAESVHLMPWPTGGVVDEELLATMSLVRSYVNIGLKLRAEKNIKVRQPLQSFWINHEGETLKYWDDCRPLLQDELNVKEVVVKVGADQAESTTDFDWTITPELKLEGEMREVVRAIQEARKTAGLHPDDVIELVVDDPTKLLIEAFEREVVRIVGARSLRLEASATTQTLTPGETTYRFGIVRVE